MDKEKERTPSPATLDNVKPLCSVTEQNPSSDRACLNPGSGDSRSAGLGLVRRGQRHHFLTRLAAVCYENGVEKPTILAILRHINAEYCSPPKREQDLQQIVGCTCRNAISSSRRSIVDAHPAGEIPRGRRERFLMFLAAACNEHNIDEVSIRAILNLANSVYCQPPKRKVEVERILQRRKAAVSFVPDDAPSTPDGSIPRGKRYCFLSGLAATCRKSGVTQTATLAVLRQANLSCYPPKSERQLKKIAIGNRTKPVKKHGRPMKIPIGFKLRPRYRRTIL